MLVLKFKTYALPNQRCIKIALLSIFFNCACFNNSERKSLELHTLLYTPTIKKRMNA